jgi:protein-disulfide isomerase
MKITRHTLSMLRTLLLCVVSSVLALFFASSLVATSVSAASPDAIAEVDGQIITNEEVADALGAPLRRLERQIYDLKRQKLDSLINQRLLAREAIRRGVTVLALLQQEVTAKVESVSDAEVEVVYNANKGRLRGTEAQLRDQIRDQLQNQKLAERRKAFVQSLRTQARVVVRLEEPPPFQIAISANGAPFRGPAEAPVTIVEFSDFHCPYCKQVLTTLTQILSRYGDKVKLVFRDFPLDGHPVARRAAEAARCAKDQDKFWEYHDLLFANAPKASPEQLKEFAKQVGLDVSSFERCLSSGTHAAAVQRDVDEGLRLGVTGTPGFFVNGRLLSGAQPLEQFVRAIEEELKRVRR